MLDIPSDEIHAHLFGGGGDHCISYAQGMALAEFPQVFSCLVGNRQVNVNGSQDIEKGSDGFIFPLSSLPIAIATRRATDSHNPCYF